MAKKNRIKTLVSMSVLSVFIAGCAQQPTTPISENIQKTKTEHFSINIKKDMDVLKNSSLTLRKKLNINTINTLNY